MDDVQAVLAELQAGYGDTTQTVLDRRVAQAILKRLRALGWASPEDVGVLVVAAGGEIRVTDAVIEQVTYREPVEVLRLYEPHTFSTVLRARIKAPTP